MINLIILFSVLVSLYPTRSSRFRSYAAVLVCSGVALLRYALRGPMGSRPSSSHSLSELLAEAFSSIAAADVTLIDDGRGDGDGADATPTSPGEPLLRAVQLGGLGAFGLSTLL